MSKIDESTVPTPKSKKAQITMVGWGTRKRQRYAHLVMVDKISAYEAYLTVENFKGVVQIITPVISSKPRGVR
jgi:hypothetical protein